MAKRRLTKQQQWRIQKVQDERSKRTSRNSNLTQQAMISGELGGDEQGLIISHFGQQMDVQPLQRDAAENRKLYRCYARANIGALVTGDEVVWRAGTDQTGVIVARKDRHSLLTRPDKFGQLKPVAANIDQILIVIAPEPAPFANLIDRYLVAAETVAIKPSIILNKSDLLTSANQAHIQNLRNIYLKLNYPWVEISSTSMLGLQPLQALLEQRTSIFAGQSGVGKSSIVGTLLPEALPEDKPQVGSLSESARKGTHTTSAARLYSLASGGRIIDSPGIREFGLWHIDEATLTEGFIEFRPYLGQCRFRDCQHKQEPGCALLVAVTEGRIAKQRFESFLHIRTSLSDQQVFARSADIKPSNK